MKSVLRPVLLNTSDLEGGAAIATHRLHMAFLQAGMDSSLLVQRKTGRGPGVIEHRSFGTLASKARRPLDQLPVRLYRERDRHRLFSPALVPDSLPSRMAAMDPDVVHLFWVNGGLLRLESLRAFNKPIVWTLHDMWAFTGGCHYDDGCGKYQDSCGRCPALASHTVRDLSRRVWQRKSRAWAGLDLTIVATSNWLADCARSSSLFRRNRVVVIPNCLDLSLFKPRPKMDARRQLGLPTDKQLILLSAFSATTDPRKGFQHLRPALELLRARGLGDRVELVVLGARPAADQENRFPATYIPGLKDSESQILLYSACDALVAPSVQENLSNTVLESLACGTPVVAFDIGGMPDLIQHRGSGYLAKPFDPKDLAAGIEWVLDAVRAGTSLSDSARAHAAQNYGNQTVSQRYESLYRELVA